MIEFGIVAIIWFAVGFLLGRGYEIRQFRKRPSQDDVAPPFARYQRTGYVKGGASEPGEWPMRNRNVPSPSVITAATWNEGIISGQRLGPDDEADLIDELAAIGDLTAKPQR